MREFDGEHLHSGPSSPPTTPTLWSRSSVSRPLSPTHPPPALHSRASSISKRLFTTSAVHTPRDSISSVASTLPLYPGGDTASPTTTKRFSLVFGQPPAYDLVSPDRAGEDQSPQEDSEGGEGVEQARVEEEQEQNQEEGESDDPLDILLRRTTEVLNAARDILETTRSTRAHFSRFLALDDSLEAASLRESVDGAGRLENEVEDVGARVEAFAEGRSEPGSLRTSGRNVRNEDPPPPVDPRPFTRATPPARPPRLQTLYLNAESTLDLPHISTLPSPTTPRPDVVDRKPEDGEETASFLGTWKASAGALSRLVVPVPELHATPSTSPSAAGLLSAIAASSPYPSRIRSASLSHSASPPSPGGSPNPSTRRFSIATSSASPSSSLLSPPLFSSRTFSPIAEDEGDETDVFLPSTSSFLTPATSRSPSPNPSVSKRSVQPPPSPRPSSLHRHSKSLSTVGLFPSPAKLSTPLASSTFAVPPPNPSAKGEDLTPTRGHRRNESGLKERLEAMQAGRDDGAPTSEPPAGGWWGSWR